MFVLTVDNTVRRGAELVEEFHAALGKNPGQGTLLEPLQGANKGRRLKLRQSR